MAGEPFGTAALRRIEWLTLVLGGAGAAWAGWRWGWRGSAGLAIGALVSWINFRWLKGSVQAFGRSATAQAGSQNVRVPVGAYIKFFARFALLLGILYVILTRSWLPGVRVGVERRAPERKRLLADRPKLRIINPEGQWKRASWE
jgi:hypothetical protein